MLAPPVSLFRVSVHPAEMPPPQNTLASPGDLQPFLHAPPRYLATPAMILLLPQARPAECHVGGVGADGNTQAGVHAQSVVLLLILLCR